MEDNFYNDDGFEEFLQRAVKNHRMYPSDSIWRNINKKLHGDTNWPALTIAAFTFLGIIIAFSFYFSPSPDFFSVTEYNKALLRVKEQKSAAGENESTLLNKQHKNELIPFVKNSSSPNNISDVIKPVDKAIAAENVIVYNNDKQLALNSGKKQNKQSPEGSQPETKTNGAENDLDVQTQPSITSTQFNVEYPGRDFIATEQNVIPQDPAEITASNNGAKEKEKTSHPESELAVKIPANAPDKVFDRPEKQQNKKLSYVVYITPSRSYRKLNQNPSNSLKSVDGPLALNYFVDVNQVVRYNPGIGVEAGVSFMYNITDKLKVATGLQFNIRQYSLEAYIAPGNISTIALTNRSGGADTISRYAVYRTSNGYLATELVNRYYEMSLPVGLVWQVLGNRNIQLNLAASVQPTYLINRNAYLLSTDFKNYTVNPGLMKSWNINSNLEAYISVKSGDFNWQIGPQFRYQNLPTSISRYPIRENLIDYGIKLGVTKNLK